jgi:hypothetical protein
MQFSFFEDHCDRGSSCKKQTAHVSSPESGVFLNVWFHYRDKLLEVIEINGDMVTCSYVEDETGNINLPINLVTQLVSSFGNS